MKNSAKEQENGILLLGVVIGIIGTILVQVVILFLMAKLA